MWELPASIQSHFNVKKSECTMPSVLTDLHCRGGRDCFCFSLLISFSFYVELVFTFQVTFLSQFFSKHKPSWPRAIPAGESPWWLICTWLSHSSTSCFPTDPQNMEAMPWRETFLVLQGVFLWDTMKKRKYFWSSEAWILVPVLPLAGYMTLGK